MTGDRRQWSEPGPPIDGHGRDPSIGELVVLGLVVLAAVVPALFSVLYGGG